jgi:hypothetical protein
MPESDAVIAIVDDDPFEPIACICSLARGRWLVRRDWRRRERWFTSCWIRC